MKLSTKFFIGIVIGCIGFLFSFIICAVLSYPTNTMLLPCGMFLIVIITCFIGFYISSNNLNFKVNLKLFKFLSLYNKNKSYSTILFTK